MVDTTLFPEALAVQEEAVERVVRLLQVKLFHTDKVQQIKETLVVEVLGEALVVRLAVAVGQAP